MVGNVEGKPGQRVAVILNVGTIELLITFTVMVVVVAHCPVFGVNVYVVVAVLLGAGDQVPVMPLFEVVGKEGKVVLIQIGATCVKVGTTGAVIGTDKVAVLAHWPALGVNV